MSKPSNGLGNSASVGSLLACCNIRVDWKDFLSLFKYMIIINFSVLLVLFLFVFVSGVWDLFVMNNCLELEDIVVVFVSSCGSHALLDSMFPVGIKFQTNH